MAEASLGPSKRSSKEASREGGPKRGRTVGRTDTQRPSQSWGPGYFLKPQVLALKSVVRQMPKDVRLWPVATSPMCYREEQNHRKGTSGSWRVRILGKGFGMSKSESRQRG